MIKNKKILWLIHFVLIIGFTHAVAAADQNDADGVTIEVPVSHIDPQLVKSLDEDQGDLALSQSGRPLKLSEDFHRLLAARLNEVCRQGVESDFRWDDALTDIEGALFVKHETGEPVVRFYGPSLNDVLAHRLKASRDAGFSDSHPVVLSIDLFHQWGHLLTDMKADHAISEKGQNLIVSENQAPSFDWGESPITNSAWSVTTGSDLNDHRPSSSRRRLGLSVQAGPHSELFGVALFKETDFQGMQLGWTMQIPKGSTKKQ